MKLTIIIAAVVGVLAIVSSGHAQTNSQLSSLVIDDTVQLLAPGVISTKFGEYNPTYDSTTDELYFMRRTPGEFDYTIYRTKLTDDVWSLPVIASFSGEFRDAAPFVSPDGNTLFFDSARPSPEVAANSINLWYTKKSDSGWSEPTLLVASSINAEDEPIAGRDEFGPVVDENGTLYFYSFRQPNRGGAHYISTPPDYRDMSLNTKLPDPSARTFVSYLYMSPNGDLALFEGRAIGRRDTNIFCSSKLPDGTWIEPIELSLINSEANEGGPYLTGDGKYLLFTSNRRSQNKSVSNANLYIVNAENIIDVCRDQSD